MSDLNDVLINEGRQSYPSLFDEYPLQHYVDLIKLYPQSAMYGFTSEAVRNLCKNIKEKYSNEALGLIHKLILLHFIENPTERSELIQFSPDAQSLMNLEFHRISVELMTNPIEYYFNFNDLFMKDLALTSNRLIFAGAQLFEPFSGLPKRSIFNAGIFKAIGPLITIIFRAKGFYPYFQIHTSDKHLNEFTEEGWDRCYVRLAQFLELNPQIKGIIGSSWFYDPALVQISPRLCYLQKRPLENGAITFFISQDKESEVLATSKSPTRKAQFDSGNYHPKKFMLLWPREALIKWSKNQKA